jgi:hypothetical protein
MILTILPSKADISTAEYVVHLPDGGLLNVRYYPSNDSSSFFRFRRGPQQAGASGAEVKPREIIGADKHPFLGCPESCTTDHFAMVRKHCREQCQAHWKKQPKAKV